MIIYDLFTEQMCTSIEGNSAKIYAWYKDKIIFAVKYIFYIARIAVLEISNIKFHFENTCVI